MKEKTLNDYFVEVYISRFAELGIVDRLRCARCQRVATTITKGVYDSSPRHYNCYCSKCREYWFANDRQDSPR